MIHPQLTHFSGSVKMKCYCRLPFGTWYNTCCITELKNMSENKTGKMSAKCLELRNSEAIRNVRPLMSRILICD